VTVDYSDVTHLMYTQSVCLLIGRSLIQFSEQTREMCSRIDMQTHAGSLELGFDLRPFDLRVSACPGPAMDYVSTDFGANSLTCFAFRAKTDRHTNRQTRLNALHHAGDCTAGVGNK